MLKSTFKKQEIIPSKTPGYYDVVLTEVREMRVGLYNVLRFFFKYADGEKAYPAHFDLFDLPENFTPEEEKKFDFMASLIFSCFGLEGSFSPLNYGAWIGSTGKIRVGLDKGGYHVVDLFVPKNKVKEYTQEDAIF